MSNITELMREALQIKARMDQDKARLAEINKAIADEAVFKDGCKTARIAKDDMMAKIQLRETVSWDQGRLRTACAAIGADNFRKIFDYEFKPISVRVLQAWLWSPDTRDEWRALVTGARIVKEASPSVVISRS